MTFASLEITRMIDLGEYDQAYTGRAVHVWLNLPREMLTTRLDLLGEFARVAASRRLWRATIGRLRLKLAQGRMFGWLARIWSRHADAETHWTRDEVRTLFETDPVLYHWLVKRSTEALDEFAAGKKK